MDKQGIGGVVCFTLHAAMLLKTLRVSFGGKIGTARRSPHGHPYLVKKKWSSSEFELHHLCEFNCSNGLCVPLFSQCDNKLNCLDFSSFTAERERKSPLQPKFAHPHTKSQVGKEHATNPGVHIIKGGIQRWSLSIRKSVQLLSKVRERQNPRWKWTWSARGFWWASCS